MPHVDAIDPPAHSQRRVHVMSLGHSSASTQVAAWLDEGGYCTSIVESPEDAYRLQPDSTTAVVVLLGEPPSARDTQLLLDLSEIGIAVICALSPELDPSHVEHLVSIGVHEVLPLSREPAHALAQMVASGLHRDRLRREAARGRERALIKRDVAAAMAVAATRSEVAKVLLDGVVALGATGASFWEVREQSVVMVMECFADIEGEGGRIGEVPLDVRHPAVAATQQVEGECAWLDEAQARVEFPDYDPGVPFGALGVFPVKRGAQRQEAVVCHFERMPDEPMRFRYEQLMVHFGDTLRRAELQTALEEERDLLRRLLSVVSHDLRNPLNTVLMASGLLDAHEDPEVRGIVQRVSHAGRSATRLVDDLLLFATSATQGIALARSQCDAVALAEAAVREANLRSKGGRRVRLSTSAAQPRIRLDPLRFEQVLGNLLSNALAYSPEDTETLVRVSDDDNALYVDVENRGRSFGEHELAELFAPMKRLSAVGERGSVGLGLYIVDRIIAAHGGSIWVEPGTPDGVRFSIQLPRSVVERELTLMPRPTTRSRAPSQAPMAPDIEALFDSLRAPALKSALKHWAQLERPDALPHPLALDRSRLLAYLPDMAFVTVRIEGSDGPVFLWNSMGPRLERRLKTRVTGQEISRMRQAVQYDAHLRCYESGRPVYDYFRQRGAHPMAFERLLLPLTRSRNRVATDVWAVVVFDEPT